MSDKLKFWAYIHANGKLMMKRYYDKAEIIAASESPFVREIFDVEEFNDSIEALAEFNRRVSICKNQRKIKINFNGRV